MDRRKRSHSLLEKALKESGISFKTKDDLQSASKKSKETDPEKQKAPGRKSRTITEEKKQTNKKKYCRQLKFEESNETRKCSSTAPVISRRITEDEENYDPEEVFAALTDTMQHIHSTDLLSNDDAASGVSHSMDISAINDTVRDNWQVYLDPSQTGTTSPRSMDLPLNDDSAPGVPHNMDLPSIDDSAPGVPRSVDLPSYDDPAPEVPRNMDLPSIDDPAPGVSRSVDLPSNDDPVPEVPRNMDLPSIDDPAPGVSRSVDLPSNDDPAPEVPRNMDLPSIDDPAPGVSRSVDLPSNDNPAPEVPRNMDFPSIDDPAPGVSRNKELPPKDKAALGVSTRKRKAKTSIRNVDYMSDEDFSTLFCLGEENGAVDSDKWVGSDTSNSDEEEDQSNKKKRGKNKKKKRKESSKNKNRELLENNTEENLDAENENVGEKGLKRVKKNTRKERALSKQTGKEYVRKNGQLVPEKSIQPNPCKGKKCGNNCENVTEEKRQQVFKHFWSLTPERRRDWLFGMTDKGNVKRKRSSSELRSYTYKYCITDGEGKRSVCLQFLAATLDISQKCIYYTVKNASSGSAKEDLRGKCEPHNKTKPSTKESAVNFIKSLPAVPSHYCRHDSTRVYLPQEYKNIAHVYSAYKERNVKAGIDIVSEKIFRKIFSEEFNISFHVPKKDKCLKCLQLQQADLSDPKKKKERKGRS
ncbi:unnamed protein product [Parnassius apollo]|uniref:(apollo) hypothetical protein n=1 Tax=Parnassius apollo TaxID=110799 RepID=A0A8S3WPZ6_PARAO|nr:unnamed protein product [Parnassius apollo]